MIQVEYKGQIMTAGVHYKTEGSKLIPLIPMIDKYVKITYTTERKPNREERRDIMFKR